MSNKTDFLFELGAFRFKHRAWSQYFAPNVANIIEHTYRVMWLCLIIAKEEKNVDTSKLLKMALVHDLPESRGVDLHYVSREFTERKEHEALIASLEGTGLDEEFIKLWEEAERRDTIEGQILKDADNLDIDLELLEQEQAFGSKLREIHKETRQNVYEKKFFTRTAKKIWEEIQIGNIYSWMQKATEKNMKNRDYSKEK